MAQKRGIIDFFCVYKGKGGSGGVGDDDDDGGVGIKFQKIFPFSFYIGNDGSINLLPRLLFSGRLLVLLLCLFLFLALEETTDALFHCSWGC